MSKLSFRARALDPCKPMPIYLAEELPDLPEYSAINRAVPQMPSGMEKEEESEHHLQRAICTGLIIPTPEVFTTEVEFYERNYPANYKMPRQLIHMQPLGLEQDIPDYDMDSADELWLNSQTRRLDLTPLKFEQMMDKLEKSSGQTVVTLNEAKALLKEDDEVSTAVYDYWLNKRLKTQHPLILSVKTENRSGIAANNPYLAFRRRTEKMQTRKNRKNDETSYEKMLKLRRDLSRAVTLLEMVKRREKTKREQLHLSIEVFEKRYQIRDFSGTIMSELTSSVKSSRPAFAPIYTNQYSHHSSSLQAGLSISSQQQQPHYSSTYHSGGLGVASTAASAATKRDLDSGSRKEKRQYKKRKHKMQREKHYASQNVLSPAAIESTISSEDEELSGTHLVGSEGEDEGLYAFRRNKFCEYHRPLTKGYGNWPWESKEDNGLADPKYRFTLTSIRHPRPRCIGFARRRVGRGGRIILDRIGTDADDLWSQLDYTVLESKTNSTRKSGETTAVTSTAADMSSSEDESISRDPIYISSSRRTITKPTSIDSLLIKNNVRKSFPSRRIFNGSDFYTSGYGNLFGLCSDDESSRVDYSDASSHKEMNSISDLLNKRIKEESVSEDDWSRLSADQSTTTTLDQRDSGIVVDLVRTQCINRISNRNISNNNNHTNYASDISRTAAVFDKRANEKSNVIKDEIATVIKQEYEMDVTNSDDENVNLASLSNILNASRTTAGTTSTESIVVDLKAPKIEENYKRSELTHSNYVDLNTSTKQLRNSALQFQQQQECSGGDVKHAFLFGSDMVPGDSDSKAVIYNEFLEEIQKNWLHFHPKTRPPTPKATSQSTDEKSSSAAANASSACVNFSEQTPIAIEMQRLGSMPPSSVFAADADSNPLFVTSPFVFTDLIGDEQLLNATTDSSNSATDFNLSGDSLNELNLSLGEDENEKMLENILEECQIDDLKALNQTTQFWDGILEDGGLLDVIDEKKTSAGDSGKDLLVNGATTPDGGGGGKDGKKVSLKRKGSLAKSRVGSSQFSITNASQEEKFFRKDDPNAAQLLQESMKCEPPEDLLEVPATVPPPQRPPTQQPPAAEPKPIVPQILVPVNSQPNHRLQTTSEPVGVTITQNPSNLIRNFDSSKVYIKQEPIAPTANVVTTTAAVNQVPINQINTSQVITLSNVKLEADGNSFLGNIAATSGSSTITTITTNSLSSTSVPTLLMAPMQHLSHQPSGHEPQSPQQHIIFRQISQAPHANQINANVSTAVTGYTDGSGAILIASTSPTKRQTNGPTDKNAIHLLKQRYANRRLTQQTIQAVKQQQLRQDDDLISVVQTGQKSQQTQHIQTTGNFIKMSPFPAVVSEINVQQHHQQQQQNTLSASAVTVASNHNYSLQPSAQPITIIGHQQQPGNKIILNTSGVGGTVTAGTNFTIATPIQDLQTKLQYGQIPTSNIKVNLVTSSGIQQGSLIMDAKNSELVKTSLQQHQTPQITVATHQAQQSTQQQRLKLEKTMNMFIDQDQKRVLCKLVNLSSLQPKNSAGQTVQVSSSTAAQILNKAHAVQRLGNSAIVANVRTLTVNNQVITASTANPVTMNPIVAVTSGGSVASSSAGGNSSGSSGGGPDVVGGIHKSVSGSAGGKDPGTVSTGINLNTTNRRPHFQVIVTEKSGFKNLQTKHSKG